MKTSEPFNASLTAKPRRLIRAVVDFYVTGFREMTVGRTLWVIILVKLFVMFAILKLFFFPDLLSRDFDNDADRAAHVRRSLSSP